MTPARAAAFEVLLRTFAEGAWTDRAFRSAAERRGLEGRERAQAQRLSYGAVQRRGTSDHVISALAGRDPAELDPPLAAALRLGIFELLFSDAVAPHAAVTEAVQLSTRAGPRVAGLANAVLRRADRERGAILSGLDEETPATAAVMHSHPEWIARLWWQELGAEAARAMLAADNRPAETALRVNTLRAEPERALAALRAEGARIALPGAGGPLAQVESFVVEGSIAGVVAAAIERGDLVPQSRASAAVVGLLDPRPGERVLDLCAGPGIKTTQIAARLGDRGEVTAIELDPRRAEEIRELCARLGIGAVSVEIGDTAARLDTPGATSEPGEVADEALVDASCGYDRVLVDPPCSSLGTLARRPDARWRRSPEDLDRLGALQERILRRGMAALRVGGTLAYSTCTISRREGEEPVAGALGSPQGRGVVACELGAEHPELASPHDRRFLQTRPDRDGTAGFFIALLRRERALGEG